jgi:hypothetical protein
LDPAAPLIRLTKREHYTYQLPPVRPVQAAAFDKVNEKNECGRKGRTIIGQLKVAIDVPAKIDHFVGILIASWVAICKILTTNELHGESNSYRMPVAKFWNSKGSS